jgi:hypothetical protein
MAIKEEKMEGRTDIHRPAEFDPQDYEVVDYIDSRRPECPVTGDPDVLEAYKRWVAQWEEHLLEYFPNWQTAGAHGITQCNHCGTHIRWVAVVLHRPTGGHLAFGEICADRCELPSRDAFRAKYIKDRAALQAAALENMTRKAAFRAAHPEVVELLETVDISDRFDDSFLVSVARQYNSKGELSERQVEALEKLISRQRERDARREQERWELQGAPQLEEGRYEITGEIVSAKVVDGDYGMQVKMLVKLENGNKVYGSMPSNVEEELGSDGIAALRARPQPVRFTAQVERSRDDEHFGFFKRPTKAALLRVDSPLTTREAEG